MTDINNHLGDLTTLSDDALKGVANDVYKERVCCVHGIPTENSEPGVDLDQQTKEACVAVTEELKSRMGNW